MKNNMFFQFSPVQNVLSEFLVCRKANIDEAKEFGKKIFCDNNLESNRPKEEISTNIFYRKIGGIGLGRMSYGGDITIKTNTMEDFILVQMPICGEENVTSGNSSVRSRFGLFTILNAKKPVIIEHKDKTEKLIMRIDKKLITKYCQQALGRTLDHDVEFNLSMPELNTVEGKRWNFVVNWAYQTASAIESIPSILAAQIESSIVSTLLATQPHNYLDEIVNGKRNIVRPGFVKRVERFIYENADRAITVADMAEHAGVSTRSLYAGFRKYNNMSPMRFLKEERLERVNEQLKRACSQSDTVTSVAYKWGFNHLGHFCSDYKKRFGETPSETLMQ